MGFSQIVLTDFKYGLKILTSLNMEPNFGISNGNPYLTLHLCPWFNLICLTNVQLRNSYNDKKKPTHVQGHSSYSKT